MPPYPAAIAMTGAATGVQYRWSPGASRTVREPVLPAATPPRLLDRVRAKRPGRLPVVLTREEVRALLQHLDGMPRLVAGLLYGAGLRVLACCRLRVQALDLAADQIVVRGGKGDKDRVTMLPAMAKRELHGHLEAMRAQHQSDVAAGAGWVELPTAPLHKYPKAGREWVWQWVFPPTRPPCSVPSGWPPTRPASPSGPAPTPCAIRWRPIFSRMATTSGRSRNCWATATPARR